MDLRELDWLVVRCLDKIASRILTFTDPVDQDCIEEAKRWMGWYIKNANKIDGKVTDISHDAGHYHYKSHDK